MRRGLVAFVALTLVGLGLTGCGLFRFEQREPWRTQAEEACLSQQLVQPSAYMSRASKIDGPGACGMDYPFKVAAFSSGSVGLTSKVTLACPIIPRIDNWLDEIVKPAALLYYGVPVVDIKAGSYSCRPRNNQAGAKVSEHAFGNAMDVMGFVFADGRQLMVVKGWRGDPADQEFLREVFVGACRYFTTVLAPGADPFHYDHIHIDLARHDPRGERHICKPILKFTPRVDTDQVAQQAPMTKGAPPDLAPIDLDEDAGAEEGSSGPPQGGFSADLPSRGGGQAAYAAATPSRATPANPSPLSAAPVYPVPAPMRAPISPPTRPQAPARRPLPLAGDPYRAPVYDRPGPSQVLNGHGLY
jgi:Extensin-like protein C-terminus